MQELKSHYSGAGLPRFAPFKGQSNSTHAAGSYYHHYSADSDRNRKHFGFFDRFSLLQKIFAANMIVILGGATVGSLLTAELAQAGKFNLVSFGIIILLGVLLSGAVSFTILKISFRPFEELQKVLTKIHTGNPRARAALDKINNPDVRQFTTALNQMLNRLEENAHIIQEDQRQLQLMTAQVINAQENERKRIARELHDEASQSLTAMIMGLEAARNNAPAENAVLQQQLGGLKELAAATLEELRKLALDLRPTMLDDLGLVPAVRWLSRGAAERANLEMKLELGDFEEQGRLAPELETCLFRITQESLTNIVKHARATEVQVRLERVITDEQQPYEQVRLVVADNGLGFDLAEARAKAYRGGHLGLFDIEERAALLGGKVEILSGKNNPCGAGTRITVLLPVQSCPVDLPYGLNTAIPPYIR
ncbi:MAG TPA: sensor histidine kinase [Chloroflexia bacterium]|nr:sensor histidine kinase [Chloroflexia bacterium]